jgi:hypothetical protein
LSIKIDKHDVKSPDQVTKTLREGFVWTTAHSQLVLGGIALFIVVGAGASIYGYLSDKKETALQEKYFTVEKEYTDKKRGFEEYARAELVAAQAKDKKAPAPDASKKSSGDLQKDFGTAIAGFETIIKESSGTTAAQMAALNLSDIYGDYGKPEEAYNVLTQVEKGLGKNHALTALVLQRMGSLLANKNDCKGAIEKWKMIADRKGLKFASDEAKLRMGLCYENLNDLAMAEQMYTEVSSNQDANADFVATKEAQKYLRLLKAKKNISTSGT